MTGIGQKLEILLIANNARWEIKNLFYTIHIKDESETEKKLQIGPDLKF